MWQAANDLAAQRGVDPPELVDRTSAGRPIWRVKGTSNPSRTEAAYVTWCDTGHRMILANTLKKAKARTAPSSSSDTVPTSSALHGNQVTKGVILCFVGVRAYWQGSPDNAQYPACLTVQLML